MGKKRKAVAGGAAAEGECAQTVRESAQQIWLAGLGAFAKAQARGTKFQAESARIFDALVREGEARQSFVRKVTGKKVAEAAAKASGTWDKLEQVFEARVARSLNSLGVPTKDDVAQLAKRVAELKAEVETLNRGAAKAATPAAAAPSAAGTPLRRGPWPPWRTSPVRGSTR